MATRYRGVLDMAKAGVLAGIRFFVTEQNRRNMTLQLSKSAIKLRRIGRVYTATLNVFWIRPQDDYVAAKWRGTW